MPLRVAFCAMLYSRIFGASALESRLTNTIGSVQQTKSLYAIGIVLALAVSVFARSVGLDRDRTCCPTVLVVIASYYVLFAVMGGSMRALVLESIVMTIFACVAVLGFKFNLWFVVAAFAAHSVYDFLRSHCDEPWCA